MGPAQMTTSRWLSSRASDWVVSQQDTLDFIYEAFCSSGQWPDPVQLQRELRAGGTRISFARAANEIPRELGWRNRAPDRVVLSLFGANRMLHRSRAPPSHLRRDSPSGARTARPAQPGESSRPRSRGRSLGLSAVEADRVSKLILADCPFLGGGNASVEAWDLEIDERVVEFEQVEDIDGLLTVLAEQRAIGASAPNPAGTTAPMSVAGRPSAPQSWASASCDGSDVPAHSPANAVFFFGLGANPLGVGPKEVVQPLDGWLAADGLVSAAMVVGP